MSAKVGILETCTQLWLTESGRGSKFRKGFRVR